MTAHDLIFAVMRDRWQRNFVLPNYTPGGWWECDVFEVTDVGYFREYEVKVSRADFFKDADKSREKWVAKGTYQTLVKHDLLAAGSDKGPSRFWYVTPPGLVTAEELPPWAGLIEVNDRGPKHRREWRYKLKEVTKARQLHKAKVADRVHQDAKGTCYWRMHRALATAIPEPNDRDWVI